MKDYWKLFLLFLTYPYEGVHDVVVYKHDESADLFDLWSVVFVNSLLLIDALIVGALIYHNFLLAGLLVVARIVVWFAVLFFAMIFLTKA